jgi:3-hydroxy-3-methylglutaryl CoA synthase
MKKRNKRTTCEATAGASAAAITIGCLPKHMEKFLVTFTCEGKPGLL